MANMRLVLASALVSPWSQIQLCPSPRSNSQHIAAKCMPDAMTSSTKHDRIVIYTSSRSATSRLRRPRPYSAHYRLVRYTVQILHSEIICSPVTHISHTISNTLHQRWCIAAEWTGVCSLILRRELKGELVLLESQGGCRQSIKQSDTIFLEACNEMCAPVA